MAASHSVVFGHLPIGFDERVLHPRDWTVAQSEWAAELLLDASAPTRVLELCAGAGHIGLLALALSTSRAHRLVSVDANPAACAFIRRNARAAGLAGRVDVRSGSITHALRPDEHFDLIIADPPWVRHEDLPQFPADPVFAIDGGEDGLQIARSCLLAAEVCLHAGGSLLLQLGTTGQVAHVRRWLDRRRSRLLVVGMRSFGDSGVIMHLVRAGSRRDAPYGFSDCLSQG